MEWFYEPWVWVAAGLALGVVETLAPGFIFLGFALGSTVCGALMWAAGPWVQAQGLGLAGPMLVFAVASAISVYALRMFFAKSGPEDVNDQPYKGGQG